MRVTRFLTSTATVALVGLQLSGCASVDSARTPYTAEESVAATVPGMGAVRFYADGPASVFDRFRRDVFIQAAARHEPVTALALSSGGADGAYGAGFLKGLSESHQRPRFTIVTGVSTGALMSPFVFLGPQYDDAIADLYTNGLAESLVKNVSVFNGLFGNALVDSDKLGRLTARFVTPEIMAAVAAEHRRGRRLLVVTTNLDAQRSVVWDMGAIANSGSPDALKLFRQVLAASASIPALFPPRLVQVEAGGHPFQEMHVDGATMRQVYVAPDEVIFGRGRSSSEITDLYVVVNNKLDPSFSVVENNTVSVAARALSTILKREDRNNVLGAYSYAASHGIGYHLTYVGGDVPDPASDDQTKQFSTDYMRDLYARGVAAGSRPGPWQTRPPLVQDPAAPASSGPALTASR